jgi:hypothetical protein
VTNDKKTIYNENIPNYRNLENTRKKKSQERTFLGKNGAKKRRKKHYTVSKIVEKMDTLQP